MSAEYLLCTKHQEYKGLDGRGKYSERKEKAEVEASS